MPELGDITNIDCEKCEKKQVIFIHYTLLVVNMGMYGGVFYAKMKFVLINLDSKKFSKSF